MKNATGDFTITFTTALPSVNYGAVITTTDKLVGTGVVPKIYAESINDVAALMTTTQLRIATNAYNPRSVSVFVTG